MKVWRIGKAGKAFDAIPEGSYYVHPLYKGQMIRFQSVWRVLWFLLPQILTLRCKIIILPKYHPQYAPGKPYRYSLNLFAPNETLILLRQQQLRLTIDESQSHAENR